MATYWMNFAKHGDPNGAGRSAVAGVQRRKPRGDVFQPDAAHGPGAQRRSAQGSRRLFRLAADAGRRSVREAVVRFKAGTALPLHDRTVRGEDAGHGARAGKGILGEGGLGEIEAEARFFGKRNRGDHKGAKAGCSRTLAGGEHGVIVRGCHYGESAHFVARRAAKHLIDRSLGGLADDIQQGQVLAAARRSGRAANRAWSEAYSVAWRPRRIAEAWARSAAAIARVSPQPTIPPVVPTARSRTGAWRRAPALRTLCSSRWTAVRRQVRPRQPARPSRPTGEPFERWLLSLAPILQSWRG